jgi:DMSO/TMAO reductase YedYZ molybdopterin-dependent catalytic subunit
MADLITRRTLITRSASAGLLIGAAPLLSGCDTLTEDPRARKLLMMAEGVHQSGQRSLQGRQALAKEFTKADLSPVFHANGTRNPGTPDYMRHVATGFADWRLAVRGLVQNSLSLSLTQLRELRTRTQITRHDCVEGWSAIGQWSGVPLGDVLKAAGLANQARYIVFRCADTLDGTPYYESIDMIDAFHPQTILAWGMNGRALPVAHGAPLRLRVERQLGYKQAKYVMAIEAVDSLKKIGRGQGGYWEDVLDYEWYAGI